MRGVKYGARLAFAVAAMLTGSLSMAAPANADTPVSVCGGGSYRVLESHDLGGIATVYLLYNGSTNCVITWKTAYVGTKTAVQAALGIWGQTGPAEVDAGQFGYYAGPVKVNAPGKCIGWMGTAARPNGAYYKWESPGPSHCG